ncbi:hypothetical protein FPZ42_02700 [Mucilaginibacter achroorhodeus]|uniref:DUF1080 domain-containing protein n=1 Tax=Mucilaginibacter achroorhodeus TaxID=2599294 RepID=A0A563U9S7_9SPHI|nr:hypothetical protein [Mucilaginibacter achroorhodeus]TWR28142.1 hypothetical protein FPZ42_02700 [Mucilaginibacter achroorhodeus]
MHLNRKLLFLALYFGASNCFAQVKPKASDFTVVNRQLNIKDDGTVQVNGVDNAGFVWLNNRRFTYGTIEFDVKGNDKLQGSFVGVAFHGLNDSTYESIYFRPFNFKADDAIRRSHGVQYIAPPLFDWPILREKYPNKYELAVTPAPDPNGWFHAKIDVMADKVSVYVNNSATPALVITPLTHTGGTKIAYWVGFGSPGDWKNLKITDKK